MEEEINYRLLAKVLTKRLKNYRQLSLHELDETLDDVIKNIQNDQVLMFFQHYSTMDALVKLLGVITDESLLDKISSNFLIYTVVINVVQMRLQIYAVD
jgi:tRNA U34 5-carboxymethylaminomethyl modifying GTPase MnmE/TrmE